MTDNIPDYRLVTDDQLLDVFCAGSLSGQTDILARSGSTEAQIDAIVGQHRQVLAVLRGRPDTRQELMDLVNKLLIGGEPL